MDRGQRAVLGAVPHHQLAQPADGGEVAVHHLEVPLEHPVVGARCGGIISVTVVDVGPAVA